MHIYDTDLEILIRYMFDPTDIEKKWYAVASIINYLRRKIYNDTNTSSAVGSQRFTLLSLVPGRKIPWGWGKQYTQFLCIKVTDTAEQIAIIIDELCSQARTVLGYYGCMELRLDIRDINPTTFLVSLKFLTKKGHAPYTARKTKRTFEEYMLDRFG